MAQNDPGGYNSAPLTFIYQFDPFPMNIRELLNDRVLIAMRTCGVPSDLPALIAPGKKAGFGDYQANCAMGAAKAMGTNPRELAAKIVAALDLEGVAEKVETVKTSEDVVVSKVGRELYEKFFKGYTRKQWGLDPSELDSSVTSSPFRSA